MKGLLNDPDRITVLMSTGVITTYCRKFSRMRRRTARPAFLRAKRNVPLLLTLELILYSSVQRIRWPLPNIVGWTLRKVCLVAIGIAVVAELMLVFRSDAPDRWSLDVFSLVEGEVALDEDDLLLDAKDEEEQLFSMDEKVSVLDEKPPMGGDEPNATAPLVDLPAMPAPAVLSKVHDAPAGKRP